jgi:hypothetical protein
MKIPDLSQDDLVDRFSRALIVPYQGRRDPVAIDCARDIRKAKLENEDFNLEAAIRLADTISTLMTGLESEDNVTPGRVQQAPAPATAVPPAQHPDAMDVDNIRFQRRRNPGHRRRPHLSAAERRRCIQEDRCFYCKQVGHQRGQCPNRPQRQVQQGNFRRV